MYQENVYHQLMNSKVEEELISEKDLFIRVELEKSGFLTKMTAGFSVG